MNAGQLIEELKKLDPSTPIALKTLVGIDWWYLETRFCTALTPLKIPLRQVKNPESGTVVPFAVIE